MNFHVGMSGGFHVLVTAIIEVNAGNCAYFDAFIQNNQSANILSYLFFPTECKISWQKIYYAKDRPSVPLWSENPEKVA